MSFTEYTARLERRLTPEQTVSWWDAKPEIWIAESARLRGVLYPDASKQPAGLGYAYQFQHLPTVELRLLQSGIRIAAYLDTLFN